MVAGAEIRAQGEMVFGQSDAASVTVSAAGD
jgi:hypothetical protein